MSKHEPTCLPNIKTAKVAHGSKATFRKNIGMLMPTMLLCNESPQTMFGFATRTNVLDFHDLQNVVNAL
jgi:hypothetical protein